MKARLLMNDDEDVFEVGEDIDKDTQKYDNILPLTERQLVKYLRKVSRVLFNKIIKDQWEKHEEAAVSYDDLRASIEGYYEENVDHRSQTDTLVQSTMDCLDKNSTERANLLKALNGVTETLRVVQEAVKDDPALNKKVIKATEAYIKNSTNLTELLTLVKSFDFHGAWNLGSRMSTIERSQGDIQTEVSSLKQDTSDIKSMMIEIYHAFKEPPSHAEGENDDMEADKEDEPVQRPILISMFRPLMRVNPELKAMTSPSIVKLVDTIFEILSSKPDVVVTTLIVPEVQVTETTPPKIQPSSSIINISQPESSLKTDKGKGIAIYEVEEPIKKLVPTSNVICPDPDEPVRVPCMINGKMFHLIDKEIQAYLDKEEEIKKAAKKGKQALLTRTEVIKVVQEKAEMIRLDPKTIVSPKAGEKFKKAQDVEHQVLKREHSQKVKRLMELNKKRAEQYSNRLKPEPITGVRVHPNSKPAVLTVFKNNDKRNFQVHSPFKFFNFRITELDELGLIIQKKKNTIVKDLMTSLGKRKKEEAHGLEPEIKVHGLECSRSLPEGVPFVNNMVIEEPDYGIFFTDVFGDQAFQRWNDIHKVGIDSLVSYLVMASMIMTLENARFSLKLEKLIAEHPDQEKLQSKRVKLEAVGPLSEQSLSELPLRCSS
ncbi:hypothetical protein Tco_1129826 [Tanacetum coccineum]